MAERSRLFCQIDALLLLLNDRSTASISRLRSTVMNSRKQQTWMVFVAGLLSIVLSLPAQATFPGKNGRIVFVQGPDIYTMNPDGSDVKQLTNLGPYNGAFWESWSPDGKQIVFNEYRSPDFLGQLWLMNAYGSNQRLLLDDTDFDDEIPSFTPDGTSVVFTRCRPNTRLLIPPWSR